MVFVLVALSLASAIGSIFWNRELNAHDYLPCPFYIKYPVLFFWCKFKMNFILVPY